MNEPDKTIIEALAKTSFHETQILLAVGKLKPEVAIKVLMLSRRSINAAIEKSRRTVELSGGNNAIKQIRPGHPSSAAASGVQKK